MADDIAITPGSGAAVATDEVSSRHFQKIKAAWGADGTANDVSAATPFPVTIYDAGVAITYDNVAHDAADSGVPAKIGGKALAGLSGVTLVAAADRTNFNAGLDGAQFVRTQAGLEDLVSGNASNTDGASTEVIAAGAAGIKHYLMGVTLTNMSSTMIYVELKSGSTVKWTCPVPANGGYTYSWPLGLPPNAAAEAWNFDPSAAATTIYCSATAFKSKI